MSMQTAPVNATDPLRFITAQPANESLARVFLGASVHNGAGETVGDINDVIFDRNGRISTVVLGIGGLLGMGEKIIAVPFEALSMATGTNGSRTITMKVSREALKAAPAFIATEKTTLDSVRDRAVDLSHKTADKANELKEQATRKINDMTRTPGPKT